MTLDELHDRALMFGRNYFEMHRIAPPSFLALGSDQRLHILVSPRYADAREKFTVFLTAYFTLHDIHSYAYVSEAWTVRGNAATDLDYRDGIPIAKIPPSKDPRRVEVLITGAVDREHNHMRSYRIERPPGRPPHIGALLPSEHAAIDRRVGLASFLNFEPPPPDETEIRTMCAALVRIALPRLCAEVAVMEPIEYALRYND